jgi:hypothetical protein
MDEAIEGAAWYCARITCTLVWMKQLKGLPGIVPGLRAHYQVVWMKQLKELLGFVPGFCANYGSHSAKLPTELTDPARFVGISLSAMDAFCVSALQGTRTIVHCTVVRVQ